MQLGRALVLVAGAAMAKVYFRERFEGSSFEPLWKYPLKSAKAADLGKFQLSSGKFSADLKNSQGLQTTEENKYYAIVAPLKEPIDNKNQPFVVQFSVKHEQNIDCGGGYIKLLGKSADADEFGANSPYEIMFGPDICGNLRKVMLLFTKEGKDFMWKKYVLAPSDDLTHMYTLVLNPDNSYEVYVDGEQRAKGDLFDDWDMAKPRKIPDPDAKKPEDWVDTREIDDPADKKPENWVEDLPLKVADSEATKPDDWDGDTDGKWEPPMIDNPEYHPKWKPRKIPNPDYKGSWKASMIDNPEFKEIPDLYRFSEPIGYVAIEVWQVKPGTIFDNFLITNNPGEAEKEAVEVYGKLKEAEVKARDEYRKQQAPSPADNQLEDDIPSEQEATKEQDKPAKDGNSNNQPDHKPEL